MSASQLSWRWRARSWSADSRWQLGWGWAWPRSGRGLFGPWGSHRPSQQNREPLPPRRCAPGCHPGWAHRRFCSELPGLADQRFTISRYHGQPALQAVGHGPTRAAGRSYGGGVDDEFWDERIRALREQESQSALPPPAVPAPSAEDVELMAMLASFANRMPSGSATAFEESRVGFIEVSTTVETRDRLGRRKLRPGPPRHEQHIEYATSALGWVIDGLHLEPKLQESPNKGDYKPALAGRRSVSRDLAGSSRDAGEPRSVIEEAAGV